MRHMCLVIAACYEMCASDGKTRFKRTDTHNTQRISSKHHPLRDVVDRDAVTDAGDLGLNDTAAAGDIVGNLK